DINTTVKDPATNKKIDEAIEAFARSLLLLSVNPKLALTNIPANVEGGNATITTEEPHFHTEGVTKDPKIVIPISSIQSTKVPPTQAQLITTITTYPESSQAAPRIDNGKGITTESDEDPSKKQV
nr:hypothetical protein [Tanacetum cinerariifolium]